VAVGETIERGPAFVEGETPPCPRQRGSRSVQAGRAIATSWASGWQKKFTKKREEQLVLLDKGGKPGPGTIASR